ncbi:MAG: ABC transporter permease subunit [Hyphomicrobium sp.]
MKKVFTKFNILSLIFGFSFLYIPILLLIVYSFNASKLVSIWGGFSTQWYTAVIENKNLLEAVATSLKVGLLSATLATTLGTLAAFVVVRGGRFPTHTFFTSMIYAPLVMPEVMTGLSLLLLFVAINLERGFLTIVLAHSIFTMSFATVVVQARLRNFDISVEEAALNLGATPLRTFFYITLPLIAPSVISAWLLSFTLSLDDLVIASFTAGPGSMTLPMKIYSQVRMGVTPEINAISTLMITAVTLIVCVSTYLSKKPPVP